MTVPLNLVMAKATPLQAHYQGMVVTSLLIIWRRKFLIVLFVIVALAFAMGALIAIGPRYTSEALIEFDFKREQPATGATTQPVAPMDAASLVESAARLMRSRATIGAVVARLRLDSDPEFAHEPNSLRLYSRMRNALGLPGVALSARDLAVNALMRRLVVNDEQHSYVVSLSITTGDPDRSAMLVNAVALEYLRGQALQQLAEAQGLAERELVQLSSAYGSRHPNFALAQGKLESLRRDIDQLRDGAPPPDIARLVAGQSFVAAEKVLVPSGPNLPVVLGLSAGGALVAGIWLALLLAAPPIQARSFEMLGEPRMEPGE